LGDGFSNRGQGSSVVEFNLATVIYYAEFFPERTQIDRCRGGLHLVVEFMQYVKGELARGLGDWEQRLNTALVRALRLAEVRQKFGTYGMDPTPGTPQQFDAFLRAEHERYGRVVRDAGIKAE